MADSIIARIPANISYCENILKDVVNINRDHKRHENIMKEFEKLCLKINKYKIVENNKIKKSKRHQVNLDIKVCNSY